jgi:hypothetical protein
MVADSAPDKRLRGEVRLLMMLEGKEAFLLPTRRTQQSARQYITGWYQEEG